MKAKKWVLAKSFSGIPTDENLKLVEFELPDELQPGEVLLQAVYWSVDPYMRIFPQKEGDVMQGELLCEVIRTRNGQFPLGSLLLSKAGWQSHFISKGDNLEWIRFDLGGTPKSYTLGTLGMPGATAYISLEKCNPKPNETIAISAAAGAVGNLVGQLAKLKGLTVIGFVGSDEKLNWCKNELHFDHVINYKKQDFSKALSEVAPNGIDIYYDNVGGEFYSTIVNHHMRQNGRVLVCGSIRTYNNKERLKTDETNFDILMKQLTVMGFMCYNHYEDWPNAFVEINKLIQEGKIKVREHRYDGIESMCDAFRGLFLGENIGKAIVKAKNEFSHYN